MITDHIKNSGLYEDVHPLFKLAFSYAKNTNLLKLSQGRHDLSGDNTFVIYMEYFTKDQGDCRLENHKKYIDIQLMLEGEEYIGVSNFKDQPAEIPYDNEKDIAFYNNQFDSLIKLKTGDFAIFYPHDLHMPCVKVSDSIGVKKAVFKIAVS